MAAVTNESRTYKPVKKKRNWRAELPSFGFVGPAALLYGIFVLWPFLNTVYLSLTDWNGADPVKEFVGLGNYRELIGDGEALSALWRNIIWIVVGTAAPIIIALVLATIVWSGVRGRLVFRTLFFMPVVLAPSVVGILWRWIYHPLFGPVNKALDAVGLEGVSRGWLGDAKVSLYALLFAAIWAYFGFAFVILMAAMQNIDESLIEAATLDGANAFRRFWHVVIPQLAPVLTMIMAFTLINGFNLFDIIWTSTSGLSGTEVLGTYSYQQAFPGRRVGYGASVTMLITVLSLTASYILITIRERNTIEES